MLRFHVSGRVDVVGAFPIPVKNTNRCAFHSRARSACRLTFVDRATVPESSGRTARAPRAFPQGTLGRKQRHRLALHVASPSGARFWRRSCSRKGIKEVATGNHLNRRELSKVDLLRWPPSQDPAGSAPEPARRLMGRVASVCNIRQGDAGHSFPVSGEVDPAFFCLVTMPSCNPPETVFREAVFIHPGHWVARNRLRRHSDLRRFNRQIRRSCDGVNISREQANPARFHG